MKQDFHFPKKTEYSVQAENITLRMLTYPIYSGNEDEPKRSVRLYAKHTHAHAELFACAEGSFHLQTESGLVTVVAGDIVIVPPDFPHHKLPSPPETVWHCLDFICVGRRRANTADLKSQLAEICGGKHLLIAHGEPELCREIGKAAHLMEKDNPSLPALRLLTILCELSAKPLQHIAPGDTARTPMPELIELGDINRLSRLDYLLNGCFTDNDLTLHRAASLLYISERQLERIMKKEYGDTFFRVLTSKRLETACSMLAESPRTVEEIATDTGFSSKATFTRAFRQKYGETPTRYRELHQKREV